MRKYYAESFVEGGEEEVGWIAVSGIIKMFPLDDDNKKIICKFYKDIKD